MKDYTRIEYGGYTVEIDIPNLFYQIKELIQKEPPKWKVRRRVSGWGMAGICPLTYGKMVYRFRDMDHLTEHYRNYIDNHIVPWKDSPNNPKRILTS
jgi:hypothetical protein